MKVLLAVAATALILVSTSLATGVAVTPGQFNALKSRVTRLESRLNAVQAQASAAQNGVNRFLSCNKQALPLTQFGQYVAFDGSNFYETTALDVTDRTHGEQVGVWVSIVDPSCVSTVATLQTARR